MTPEELKEGRRLLERNPLAFQQWLWHHKDFLLAAAEQLEAAKERIALQEALAELDRLRGTP